MRDIISGLVVLGIGLLTGSSILRGNFSILSILFDLFALFFIGRGLYKMVSPRGR
jgi:hypothetical protein